MESLFPDVLNILLSDVCFTSLICRLFARFQFNGSFYFGKRQEYSRRFRNCNYLEFLVKRLKIVPSEQKIRGNAAILRKAQKSRKPFVRFIETRKPSYYATVFLFRL